MGNWAVGVIAFLHYKEDRITPIRCIQANCGDRHGHTIDDNAQEHPVVILNTSKRQAGDKELMLNVVMTSSNPQPYGRRWAKSRSLPIRGSDQGALQPSDDYMAEHTLDLLATRGSKRSFVLSDHVFRVPFSELQCWYDSEDRLSKKSYKALMSIVGLESAAYVSFTPASKRKRTTGWGGNGSMVDTKTLSTIKSFTVLADKADEEALDTFAKFQALSVSA